VIFGVGGREKRLCYPVYTVTSHAILDSSDNIAWQNLDIEEAQSSAQYIIMLGAKVIWSRHEQP